MCANSQILINVILNVGLENDKSSETEQISEMNVGKNLMKSAPMNSYISAILYSTVCLICVFYPYNLNSKFFLFKKEK